MGSRWTRIAVPAIGLFAVVSALALIAFAPVVLFPESEPGSLPGAPQASREVSRVTAPPLRSSHGRTRPAVVEAPASSSTLSSGEATLAAVGGVAGQGASKPGRSPAFRGDTPGAEPSEPPAGKPKKDKGKHKGHGEGKAKAKCHGKVKGHGKVKHHGKAKGHSKAKH